jgi:AcrR family transcriptional regulator
MSNESASIVRKAVNGDPRIGRSTQALGAALVELMLEQDFNDITVQSILDRAGVSRSTFYAHYRNKDDVLQSSYERMFGWLEHQLEASCAPGVRVAPLAEFLGHLVEADPVVRSLRTSGQLDKMLDLGVAYFARMIEARIRPVAGTTPSAPPSLVSRMLAGALMEMVKWWEDHRSAASASQMDATFQALAHTFLLRASYQAVR